MKVKVWHIIAITACFTALLAVGGVSYFQTVKRLKRDVTVRDNKIATYEIQIGSLREYVHEVNLDVSEAYRQLSLTQEEKERLEQLSIRRASMIGDLRLKIAAMQDSLVVYKDSLSKVPVVYVPTPTGDTVPMVEVPLYFGWEDEWAKSWAEIDIDGQGVSGFEIGDMPISLTLGSRGFFKKDYVSAVTTNNPYVSLTYGHFQIVKQPKWKPIVISGATGLLIGTVVSAILLSR